MNVFISLILLSGVLSFSFGVASARSFDVFLSCTSDDIRKGFLDHLYKALIEKRIRTFREEDGIPTGEKVTLTIKKVLYTSKVSVVVFSKNYAKSMECLDELVMIMECVQTDECILVPVYLKVNRSDVQEQTGPFYEAFAVHEMKLEEKMDLVERYRTAFREAGEIKGPSLMNGYESQFIEMVVLEVKITLKKVKPKAASYFNWNNLLLVGSIVLIAIVVFKACQLLVRPNFQEKLYGQEDGKKSSSDSSSDGKESISEGKESSLDGKESSSDVKKSSSDVGS